VQPHLDLIGDGLLALPHLVSLPENRDLSGNDLLVLAGLGVAQRKIVQQSQLLGYSAARREHRTTRDLGGVSGKYRDDPHLAQALEGCTFLYTGTAQPLQGADQRAG